MDRDKYAYEVYGQNNFWEKVPAFLKSQMGNKKTRE